MTGFDLRASPSGRPRGMTSTEPRVVPTHRQGLDTVSARDKHGVRGSDTQNTGAVYVVLTDIFKLQYHACRIAGLYWGVHIYT